MYLYGHYFMYKMYTILIIFFKNIFLFYINSKIITFDEFYMEHMIRKQKQTSDTIVKHCVASTSDTFADKTYILLLK